MIDPTTTLREDDQAAEQVLPARPALTVLVVDDNPATRYSTSRILRAGGFNTREAATGSEALERADGDISAVVLDVHLPDINGFEVCRLLRERRDTKHLPVIHLSAAYVETRDKVRGLHLGADAYMTHPADPDLLIATVQALMRVRTAEEGRRRSEARFRAIFDQAPNGIVLIDGEGRFVEVNAAMLGLLQREPSAVVGQRMIDLAPAAWREQIAGYLEKSREGRWSGEFPLQTRGGELVPLEWSLSAHLEPGVMLGIATDISERVALSRQREQLLEREQVARATAERLSRSKDEFVAVLSHELRTPLNAILGWVHVLNKASTPENLERGLEAIERNANTQTRLISDILDLSRIDVGKLSLDLEMVNAAEVVSAAVGALKISTDEKSLAVNVDVAGVTMPILADAARLQQIVWNLITNAIKFSEFGGTVDVRLTQDDAGITLAVQDRGVGIKSEFLPLLFERFTQSDPASNRRHGGLGLGLSIVKQLAELHGGTVEAHSEGIGKGATFVVTLPTLPKRLQVESTTPGAALDADDNAVQGNALAGLTIIVIDDDPGAREMLSMILRDRAADVLEAADYAEGLHNIATFSPDIVVCDIGMPGKDGYELIRAVRQRERDTGGGRLPAIALTAFARGQDRDAALLAGFDAHCPKPMQPGELITSILKLSGRG